MAKRKTKARARKGRGSSGGFRPGRWLAVLLLVGVAWLGISYAMLPDVSGLAKENPESTAMMRARAQEAEQEGKKVRFRQHWVGLNRIPSHVVDAVLVSEDASFYQHEGVDWFEVKASVKDAVEKQRAPRGASTLTQQLAKNLYLSEDRSLLRKAKELVIAKRLEESLEKRRILELYLNIAEWGDGVWGIEAAARTHFGRSASKLTVAQGAMLAAMLPAPRQWTPRKQPALLRRRAARLVGRLERSGRITAAQAQQARIELGIRKAPEAPQLTEAERLAQEAAEEQAELERARHEEVAAVREDDQLQTAQENTDRELDPAVEEDAAAEEVRRIEALIEAEEAFDREQEAVAAPRDGLWDRLDAERPPTGAEGAAGAGVQSPTTSEPVVP
jgi:monofunctional biosynthetic peptidoglycan transglycosylase